MSVHRGGGIPACIAGGIPACLAAGLQGEGGRWYPSMACRFPGPHPSGKLRGIWSRCTPKGEVEGDLAGRGTALGGGVCSGEGCLLGVCLLQGCLLWGEVETPLVMATAAGGTHPTGMHSCCICYPLPLALSMNWCSNTHCGLTLCDKILIAGKWGRIHEI